MYRHSNNDVLEERSESLNNETNTENQENEPDHTDESVSPQEAASTNETVHRHTENNQDSRHPSASGSQRRERRSSSRTSISASALPLIDITRRLSLQANSSGNAINQNQSDVTEGNAVDFNSMLRGIPIDNSRYANKLPGGSRYFVSPLEDTSRRNSSISHSPVIHDNHPLSQRSPSASSWNEDSRRNSSAHSERHLISHHHRNIRTARNRPVSSASNHIQVTDRCGNPSAKCKVPSYSLYNIDFYHLPPGGPDCYPGCGYSGLPCYVCSTKHLNEDLQGSELATRSSIFTVLQPTHQSRGQQTFSSIFSDEQRTTGCQAFFKPCSQCCQTCLKRIRNRIHLPNSRLKQLGLTCFIVYLLLIIHIGVTRLLRDYHL